MKIMAKIWCKRKENKQEKKQNEKKKKDAWINPR